LVIAGGENLKVRGKGANPQNVSILRRNKGKSLSTASRNDCTSGVYGTAPVPSLTGSPHIFRLMGF